MKILLSIVISLFLITLFAQDELTVIGQIFAEDEVNNIGIWFSNPIYDRGGDINNDGYDDFFRRYYHGYGNGVSTLGYWGSSQFDTIPDIDFQWIDNIPSGTLPLWQGDYNGDGFNDLVVTWRASDLYFAATTISFQDGGFDPTFDLTFQFPGYGYITFGGCDFNNDGFDDIIAKSTDEFVDEFGMIYVMYGGNPMDTDVDITLSGVPGQFVLGNHFTIGDVNGDSIPDLILSYNEYILQVYCGGTNFGTPTGELQPTHPFISDDPIANGDFNGDGFDDICFAHLDTLYINWGNESLTFPFSTVTIPNYDSSLGNMILFYCNINNDGFDDLVVSFNYSDQVYIYTGGEIVSSTPTFEITIDQPLFYPSNLGMDLGDINGDGQDDIIISDGGYNDSATIYTLNPNSNEDNTQPILTEISNYPNPFTDTTTFKFKLDKVKLYSAKLQIFNTKGQEIREIPIETSKDITWDGKNQDNGSVPSGIYFYRLETNETTVTKKMLLLK